MFTALLLYPGEEGRTQSKAEDFWVKVDDYKKRALPRNIAFTQQVAKLYTRLLDRVFGKRIWSAKFVCVSRSYALATFAWLETAFKFITQQTLDATFWLAVFVASIMFGIVSVSLRRISAKLAFAMAVFAALFIALWWMKAGVIPTFAYGSRVAFAVSLVLATSFIWDALFVGATRWLLRWAYEMKNSLTVLVVWFSYVLFAILLSGPAIYVLPESRPTPVRDLWTLLKAFAVSVSCTNLFDALLALVFAAIVLLLLIHRLMWPILSRSVFRVQAIGTTGRRVILGSIGLAFVACSRGNSLPELAKDLVKALLK